jgi:hypothetical protein
MAGDFYAYLWLLAGYAKWLLTGGPFLMDTLLKRYRPDYAAKLDRFIAPELRRQLEIGVLIAAIFFAGFLTWRDEHNALIVAEGHRMISRRLSDSEKENLRRAFQDKNKEIPIILVQSISGVEPGKYAFDFVEFFKSINLNAVSIGREAIPYEDDAVGLMVGLRDKDHPSDSAKAFISGLLGAGFQIRQVEYDRGGTNAPDFDLFIGAQSS